MTQIGAVAKKVTASTELAGFDAVFPELVEELTKNQIKHPEIADAFVWFKEVLHYNVPSGKKLKGLSVVTSYKHLLPEATEADLKIARVLGWCVELACLLMYDDVMDNSLTRRGQLCWYKKDKVGLTAINDAFFVECCVYRLLRKYIRDMPYYLPIMELFQQATLQMVIGQCLDLTSSKAQGDFSQFTIERFNAIAKWKTAFFAFYCPVVLALHMAGISDEETHRQARPLLLQMGQYHQAHNDYLDCYGANDVTRTIGNDTEKNKCNWLSVKALEIAFDLQKEELKNDYFDCYGANDVTRKIGNDIEENKCSWLIVKALEIASDEQKEELRRNYGRCEKQAIENVKAIYRDLKLQDVYKQYEESSYQDISNLINSLDSAVPKEVFLDFIRTVYRRDK